eukprot:scaffold74234_cov61-Attheya_sp.AAC.1
MDDDHKVERWQHDNRKGWLWMLSYWSIGILVGSFQGYLFTMKCKAITVWHAVVLVVTIWAHGIMASRFGNFGRQTHWPWIVVFAICNGVCETMLFLASYDLGRNLGDSLLAQKVITSTPHHECHLGYAIRTVP